MKVGDKPYLAISRMSQAGDEDVMQVQLVNPETDELFRVSVSMEAFARILSGERLPAEVVRYKPQNPA